MGTITSSPDIERLFSQGRRMSHGPVSILYVTSPDGAARDGRTMFVAGKKLGGAVVRNRCKRVLRETCRRAGGPWRGWDVALVARAGTVGASPAALDGALAWCLDRAGIETGPR